MLANQPDTVVADKEQKTVTEVSIPAEHFGFLISIDYKSYLEIRCLFISSNSLLIRHFVLQDLFQTRVKAVSLITPKQLFN